jgi:hypothetical protein
MITILANFSEKLVFFQKKITVFCRKIGVFFAETLEFLQKL